MSINIKQIISESKNFREAEGRIRGHLKERADYYRKNNVPEVGDLIEKSFLTESFFVVPFEDKEKILLVSYEDHKIILKDYTSAIIKVIELSGLCYQGVCNSFSDILNLIKNRVRITDTEEDLSVVEIFLTNVIYQLKENSALSCGIQIDYLVGRDKDS